MCDSSDSDSETVIQLRKKKAEVLQEIVEDIDSLDPEDVTMLSNVAFTLREMDKSKERVVCRFAVGPSTQGVKSTPNVISLEKSKTKKTVTGKDLVVRSMVKHAKALDEFPDIKVDTLSLIHI